ncbi:hypothetical protein [Candidatus Kuenenia stuttgartiensis]|uniref:hypothetical protein n=1 Tax=Kuenenia stuttgartiensis TaxID=174633 RepID=UPI00146C4822|nr:hypothetical protein [Candidatus Kuenenia stuttgartiensis]
MARPISVVSDFEFLRENGIDVIVTLSEWPLHKNIIRGIWFYQQDIPIADLTPPTQEQIRRIYFFCK